MLSIVAEPMFGGWTPRSEQRDVSGTSLGVHRPFPLPDWVNAAE